MAIQATPYTIPLAVSALIVGTLLVLTITKRHEKGAYLMIALFTPIVVWSISYALQLGSTTLDQALLWNTVRFIGPAFASLSFLLFAFRYTDRSELLTGRNVALLAAVPTLTIVLVWTNYFGLHELIRVDAEMITQGGIERLSVTYGPWYYVHALYSLGVSFVAAGLFAAQWPKVSGRRLRQTQLFLFGGVVPTLGSLLYAADLTAIDWGPVTYIVTAITLTTAIFYY
ncbi:histidine kinase N-terminal 7TM domain-containing protein [Halorientalis pallida]|nr:histidine kinase N-terminal 7TM domain-containing protein [Halorientalis pallida]